jgi:hypothetical protein
VVTKNVFSYFLKIFYADFKILLFQLRRKWYNKPKGNSTVHLPAPFLENGLFLCKGKKGRRSGDFGRAHKERRFSWMTM